MDLGAITVDNVTGHAASDLAKDQCPGNDVVYLRNINHG
jgi:hypothetical protein